MAKDEKPQRTDEKKCRYLSFSPQSLTAAVEEYMY